jgi:hypothetical protein
LACDCYILDGGGITGSTFSYKDCDSVGQIIDIGRGVTGYTCSSEVPVLISGVGNVLGTSGGCVNYEWEITFNAPGGSYTTYSCGGSSTTSFLGGGTFNACSTITPTSSSPNFVSAINIGLCP